MTIIPVIFAGLFMLGLAGVAIFAPAAARSFLRGFASSKIIHFLELSIRLLVGGAMIASAPRMQFTPIFTVFGWVLVATTVVMGLIPWTLHQRFAARTVPMATNSMSLITVGSLLGGVLILWSVFGS